MTDSLCGTCIAVGVMLIVMTISYAMWNWRKEWVHKEKYRGRQLAETFGEGEPDDRGLPTAGLDDIDA